MKDKNDLIMVSESGVISVLVLIVATDAADHSIRLQMLECNICIKGNCHGAGCAGRIGLKPIKHRHRMNVARIYYNK